MAVSPCPLRAADSERLFGCKISSNTSFLSWLVPFVVESLDLERMGAGKTRLLTPNSKTHYSDAIYKIPVRGRVA